MPSITNKLKGGDLRSLGNTQVVISEITNQQKFDGLFNELFNKERIVAMRAADAIEKITITHPKYLDSHKNKLLELFQKANHIELKWHLAQLIPRLICRIKSSEEETGLVWNKLTQWALDNSGSRIVRVNSIQALFDIQSQYPELRKDFTDTLSKLDRLPIPSIVARIKKLRKQMKS
ncbi:MAG TPA: hypothetical protein VK808_02090 [Bacteroidia bacterium]|jgi:hypothetical protein|nr:hypothetical protein [Bacteroidia bacterium]